LHGLHNCCTRHTGYELDLCYLAYYYLSYFICAGPEGLRILYYPTCQRTPRLRRAQQTSGHRSPARPIPYIKVRRALG
jgi:hypothetical protein